MQKLAIYWTTLELDQLYSKLNLSELTSVMSTTQSLNYSDHYLLSPVSAQAHLKRNRSEHPLRNSDSPRIACDLQLDEVPLQLVDVSIL